MIEAFYSLGLFVAAAGITNQCREEAEEGGLSNVPDYWPLTLCLNLFSGGNLFPPEVFTRSLFA